MTDKSKHDPSRDMSHRRNEGEGNKTVVRRYNQAQGQFVDSGKVDEQANAAEKVFDSAERFELEHAELVGKRHVAKEDPAAKKR